MKFIIIYILYYLQSGTLQYYNPFRYDQLEYKIFRNCERCCYKPKQDLREKFADFGKSVYIFSDGYISFDKPNNQKSIEILRSNSTSFLSYIYYGEVTDQYNLSCYSQILNY
jgi:hypothetical protein